MEFPCLVGDVDAAYGAAAAAAAAVTNPGQVMALSWLCYLLPCLNEAVSV